MISNEKQTDDATMTEQSDRFYVFHSLSLFPPDRQLFIDLLASNFQLNVFNWACSCFSHGNSSRIIIHFVFARVFLSSCAVFFCDDDDDSCAKRRAKETDEQHQADEKRAAEKKVNNEKGEGEY